MINTKHKDVHTLEEKTMKNLDITSEQYRTYHYPDFDYTVQLPQYVILSDSGTHRVLDAEGVSHWIAAGFKAISWKVKEGEKNFTY